MLGAHHDAVHKDDDIQALRGRVDQSAVDHVVLRVPRGNRTLKSPLGMRLLRLHAESRGVVLIIETRSRAIRAYARDQGLTAVGSVRTRELYEGRLRSRRAGVPGLRLPIPVFALIGRVTLGVFAGLAAVAALVLVLPQTTVRIAPELSTVTITVPVEARLPETGPSETGPSETGPSETGHALPAGVLPARCFSTIVAHVDRARSSGVVETPDTNARGEVEFSNRSEAPVTLPAGTLVRSEAGLDFRTRTAAVVAAGAGRSDDVPVETVEVEALVAGPAGNVAAGVITGVEPGLAGRIDVLNPDPLSGGTTRSARAPTADDREALRETGIERLRERGLGQLSDLSGGSFVFHPESAAVAVQEERFDPPLGAVGTDVEITQRASVSVLGVDLVLLEQLAAQEIAAPHALAGFVATVMIVPGSVAVQGTSAARFDPATGTIRFDMLVNGAVTPVIGELEVKGAVQWKSTEAAEQALTQRFALRAPAQVHVTPSLMPRTALFGFRVKVEIDLGADPSPSSEDTSPVLAVTP